MKRAALIAVALSCAAFAAAEPLPEPLLVEASLSESAPEYPLPEFGFELPVSISALWAESPDPLGVDFFDPSLRVADLWIDRPFQQAGDPFIPTSRAAELWAAELGPSFVWDSGHAASPISLSPSAAFAQESSVATDAEPEVDAVVLRGLLNNEHYRESLRLKRLAQRAFDFGDYDASAAYAADAAAAARRSDEYVALRLKIRAVDEAIARAKARLDWAASVGAERTFAAQYAAASAAFAGAQEARAAENYDLALELARKAVSELASVTEQPPAPPAPQTAPLPKQYRVRPWAQTKDCFWTIAGYPWVYGDPTKWPLLYEANKSRIPRPDNPNLVRVGTMLTIPSIRGEHREGVWEQGKVYSPLPGR